MDASYNGTGGFNNGGNVSQPVSYGEGDIVLVHDEKVKGGKNKKRIVIILIAFLVLIGVVVALLVSGVFTESEEERSEREARQNAEFYSFLMEREEKISGIDELVYYYYRGQVNIRDFVLSEEWYDADMKTIDDGVVVLEELSTRLKKGPQLTGVVGGINIEDSYNKLKENIDGSVDEYKKFGDLTRKLYETYYSDRSVEEILDGYNMDAVRLGNSIREARNMEVYDLPQERDPFIAQVYFGNCDIEGIDEMIGYINNLKEAIRDSIRESDEE